MLLLLGLSISSSEPSGCDHLKDFCYWACPHCCDLPGMRFSLTGCSHDHHLTIGSLADWKGAFEVLLGQCDGSLPIHLLGTPL